MKKYFPIYLYGAIIILDGILLQFTKYSSFNTIKLSLGISLIIGALLAFMAAFSQPRKQVQFSYHEMHAFAILVYGVSVLVFGNTIEKLICYTGFLFIFYSFSEIIFCFWLFNLGQKVKNKIIIIRFVLGFLIGLGAMISMYFSSFTLLGFGILFIMVGVNIMCYAPVMKGKEQSEVKIAKNKR